MLKSNLIGNKITEARKKVNLSQAQLAERLFISPQAVGKWERGESMPDISTLNRLAEIFGVDLNYFSDSSQTVEKEIVTKESKGDDSIFPKLKDNLGLNWNMSGESYIEADFSGIKNVKEKLSGSSFKRCKLIKADLSNISFKGNSITDCDFANADLRNSRFYGSEIKVNSFVNSSLIDAKIVASEIRNCDFSNADLRNSRFYGSEIKANSFVNSSLIDAKIVASEIRNCDFSNANLSGIEVSTSEFRNSKVENTNWQLASFKSTQFTEIIFSGLLEGCSFSSCAFSKVTFKNSTIKNSFFKYSNLKRVQFINCKVDKITYAFLKSNHADLTGITLLDSQLAQERNE